MLEWAVLAPVSADVVVSLLPYADAVAIQSTLRLSLDMFGGSCLERGGPLPSINGI